MHKQWLTVWQSATSLTVFAAARRRRLVKATGKVTVTAHTGTNPATAADIHPKRLGCFYCLSVMCFNLAYMPNEKRSLRTLASLHCSTVS